MKALIFVSFIICAIQNCTSCESKSSESRSLHSAASISRSGSINGIPGGTTHPSNLTFRRGDIIACDIESVFAASHLYLATSDGVTIIHAPGPSSNGAEDQTRVIEEDFVDAASKYNYCKVITNSYDEKYRSRCARGPFTADETIKRADKSVKDFRGRVTHYDKFKCNCEHWVSAWKYGSSFTLQAGVIVLRSKYRSKGCEAPGKQECF